MPTPRTSCTCCCGRGRGVEWPYAACSIACMVLQHLALASSGHDLKTVIRRRLLHPYHSVLSNDPSVPSIRTQSTDAPSPFASHCIEKCVEVPLCTSTTLTFLLTVMQGGPSADEPGGAARAGTEGGLRGGRGGADGGDARAPRGAGGRGDAAGARAGGQRGHPQRLGAQARRPPQRGALCCVTYGSVLGWHLQKTSRAAYAWMTPRRTLQPFPPVLNLSLAVAAMQTPTLRLADRTSMRRWATSRSGRPPRRSARSGKPPKTPRSRPRSASRTQRFAQHHEQIPVVVCCGQKAPYGLQPNGINMRNDHCSTAGRSAVDTKWACSLK